LPISIPLGLLIVSLFVAFLVLCWPYLAARHYYDRRRLLRRLRTDGRLADWSMTKAAVVSGRGKFIVEIYPKGYGDLWWIDANADLPLPPARRVYSDDRSEMKPAFEQMISPTTREWCDAHLPALASRASLVTGCRQQWRDLPEHLVLAIYYNASDPLRTSPGQPL
jgi:hypothetical protein